MHNNAEVMYHLESRQYTKQIRADKTLNFLYRSFELLDDIQEEYYEFVRHLLLRCISKQIDDHKIDTMVDWISCFRS